MIPAVGAQQIAGQPRLVVLAGFVEPPVFGNAHSGVIPALAAGVDFAGAFGGYFQDEIRRFALLGYDVAVVCAVQLQVGVKGHQQVGVAGAGHAAGDGLAEIVVAGDQRGFLAAQVLAQGGDEAGVGYLVVAGHIIRLALRPVGQAERL